MCGIFGFVGSVPPARCAEFHGFLTRLAILASERGRHATGYAAFWTEDGSSSACFEWSKAPGDASRFVSGRRWAALRKALPSSLIGHCRYSTGTSPLVNANNHPFVGDRFAVTHNGVVRNVTEIVEERDLRLAPWQSRTDSEVILHVSEAAGEQVAAARDVLRLVEGAASVATLDLLDGSVAIYTNGLYPLVAVEVPRWRSTVYASTRSILCRALLGSTRSDHVGSWGPYRGILTPTRGDLSDSARWQRRAVERIEDLEAFRVRLLSPYTVAASSAA